jgi:hypothetical protein
VRKFIPLACLTALLMLLPTGSANAQTIHRWGETFSGSGWDRAGFYCDFKLISHGRYSVRAAEWRQDGKVTKTIIHELRVERFRNGRTGQAVIATSRYTTKLGRHGPFRLMGSLMQVRADDGTLLLSSAGSVTIDDIQDHYEFLKQPKHATLVPGFTEIPGLCELLGGHTVVD